MPKNPFLAEKIVLKNGGTIETEAGTSAVSVSAAGVITVSSSSTSFTDITATGNSTLGNGGSDTVQVNGTLTTGVNDTGYDVKFFGATSGKYWLWDESADQMVLAGSSAQTGNAQLTGTLTVGVDDTGHDVQFFGATTGKYMLWDESADKLIVVGTTDAGTSCEADAYTVGGVAGADFGPAAPASITVVKGIVTAASS